MQGNNWSNFVAGQTIITKFILILFISLLCLVFSFVSIYLEVGLFWAIVIGTQYKVVYIILILAALVFLVSTSYWDWNRGVGATLLFTLLVIACSPVLKDLTWIKLPIFLIAILAGIIVQVAICGITFLATRAIIALIKILFIKHGFVELIVSSVTLLATIPASLLSFAYVLNLNPDVTVKPSEKIGLEILAFLLGLGLVLSLVIAALIVNRRRQVPWHYPDLIRDLALAVGSWRGTSFHDLDLSNVNFAGAKLANTDLRAEKLYRTCFQGVIGLERARVDNQYLDLAYPKVQKLLTHGCSPDPNFRKFNLQGAYLQGADMRGFDLTDTNLTGADLKGADLRGSTLIRTQLAGSDLQGVDLRKNVLIDANLTEADFRGADLRDCILVRTQVARTNFEEADMTGICIEDWSVSSQTNFQNVRCDYVFKQYENGHPTHRYPVDRNFEPGEFAALFQQPQNELELIFKGDFSYSALSLAFYKLQTEEPELNLELKGIEQRGNLWVVRVTSTNPAVEPQLEKEFSTLYQSTPVSGSGSLETTIKDSIYRDYEDIKQRLAESQQLVRQLTGIFKTQTKALEKLSKQKFGHNFYILGGNITNMTAQGQIKYAEAAGQVRSLVTVHGMEAQLAQGSQSFLAQFQDVATTPNLQIELIQQILLKEAQSDRVFKRFLLQQRQKILAALPPGEIATAVQGAIAQLTDAEDSSKL